MRDYDLTINAGGSDRRDVIGNFIKVKTASVELRIRAEDADGQSVADLLMSEGAYVNLPTQFQTIRIENPTGSSTTATLIVGRGVVDDSQLSGTVSVSGTISTAETTTVDNASKGLTLASAAHTVGIAAAQLLAADSTRRSVLIKNMSAADSVWLGHDATVTASNGFEVEPGQVLAFDKSAAAEFFAIGDVAAMDVRTFAELN